MHRRHYSHSIGVRPHSTRSVSPYVEGAKRFRDVLRSASQSDRTFPWGHYRPVAVEEADLRSYYQSNGTGRKVTIPFYPPPPNGADPLTDGNEE